MKMNEETKPVEKSKSAASQKLAVIRLRGPIKMDTKKEDTLKMLKLHRKNYCIIIDKNPSMVGMLEKVKSCITWGEIDNSTLKELTEKRGEKTKKDGKEQLKPFFRMHPPIGGFERKGIKVPFSHGGAFGDRKEKINDLIRRML